MVILQTNQASQPAETAGFTFGFEVNESLLAMSNEKDKTDTTVNSDTLNNGDNNISDTDGSGSSGDNKSLVFNHTFEDNEMMKRLLLCSETSQEDFTNDNGTTGNDNQESVVTESQCLKDSLKTLYCDVDNLNIKNFNYDVIVHFVRQAWDAVSREMKSGSPVCYYSS